MVNKKLITLAIGSVLGLVAGSASSALPPKAQLQLDAQGGSVTQCVLDGGINPDTGDCINPDTGLDTPALNVESVTGSYFILAGALTGLNPLDLANPLAGGVRLTEILNSVGSHSGVINGTEVALLDAPWVFSSNTGMHGAILPIVISEGDDGAADSIAGLDFEGWNVTWSGIPAIAMGGCQFGDRLNNAGFSGCDRDQDGVDELINTGVATVKCFTTAKLRDENAAATAPLVTVPPIPPTPPVAPAPDAFCSVGDFYLLDHFANVPAGDPSGFQGAGYVLHLEGVIADTNLAPVSILDPLLVSMSPGVGTTATIDLLANVSDPDEDGIDASSFIITYTGTRATPPTLVDDGSGVITYTDNDGTATAAGSPDIFTYTVTDILGKISAVFTVEVNLNFNPIASGFTVVTDIDQAITVDVIPAAGDPDGTVDPATVVAFNPVNGTLDAPDAVTGQVLFTPTAEFAGAASFDYTVEDNDGLISNVGTVAVTVNRPPVITVPDAPADLDRNTSLILLIPNIASDTDGGIVDALTTVTQGMNGGTVVISLEGSTTVITYTPLAGYIGADDFDISVTDTDGSTVTATYNISVNNVAPVAGNDSITVNTFVSTSVNINILANDRDVDGTIDVINIITQPTVGTAVITSGCEFLDHTHANPADEDNDSQPLPPVTCITYTVPVGVPGAYFLEYSITDNDGDSDTASVAITVADAEGILDLNAYLFINRGSLPASGARPEDGNGSWFSMQLKPVGELATYRAIAGFDDLRLSNLGVIQPGSSAAPGIDEPWEFSGSTGVHKTDSPVTVFDNTTTVGTAILNFEGWAVLWNNLPFTLGFGEDDGFATVICATDCKLGDTYILDYSAQVPPDAAAFPNIRYKLHLEGTISNVPNKVGGRDSSAPFDIADISVKDEAGVVVSIAPGSVASAAGNTTGIGLTSGQVSGDPLLNPGDGEQCIGGCLDFVADNLTPGNYIDLVVRLIKQLPSGAVFRKEINGVWSAFDTSQGDQIGSADTVNDLCQQPEGTFNVGLREGAQCVFLRITDGGPNDADGVVNGVIVDPSGALLGGSPNVPASGSNSGGCSISSSPVAITERSDWLLVAAFLAIIALRRRKSIKR